MDYWKKELPVSCRSIINKVLELNEEFKEKNIIKLKKWAYRFLKRNALTIRKITHNTISIPVGSQKTY